MNYPIRTLIMVVFLGGLAVTSAFAGAVELNSACVFGSCASPDQITFGNSVTDSFNFVYTTGLDTYGVSGTIDADYGVAGTVLSTDLSVVYAGPGPSVANDSFTIDIFQDFFDAGPGTWNGIYTENVPITVSGTVGAGTSVSANLYWSTPPGASSAVGTVGPYIGAGTFGGARSASLTGLTGNTLAGDFRFSFNFGAGTEAGATDAITASPEPAETLPLAILFLIGAGVLVSRRLGDTPNKKA